MAELELIVTKIDGREISGGQAYDEFRPMDLVWREPGMMYRWLDRHPQVMAERKRQGWLICNMQRDFADKGCPENMLPATDNPGGEIIFGECILAKMPLSKYKERYKRDILVKMADRRRANIDMARAEGERVAHALRARGIEVKGNNIVTGTDSDELNRDWNSQYDLVTKDGERRSIGDPHSKEKR